MMTNPERRLAIVEHFRQTHNLQATGTAFGVSRERVRQVLVRHARETGEHIERGYGRGNQRVAKIAWKCADCGKEKRVLPCHAKGLRCPICAARHNTGSDITDDLLDIWIEQRRSGLSWYRIAQGGGRSTAASHQVPRAIWVYLIRTGRTDEIDSLWPPEARRHWLKRYTPERYEHLLRVA